MVTVDSPYVGIASEVHDFEKRLMGRMGIIGKDAEGKNKIGPVILGICKRCGFDCSWPSQPTTIACIPQEGAADSTLDQEMEF